MSKSKIAVIGAGLMGHGIAYIFAAAGNRVSIYDPDKLALSSVVGRISEIFELLEQPPGELDNIYIFENMENAIEQAEVVIEVIPEQLELKKALFEQLILNTPQETILATNTSGIPIEQIAKDTKEPQRILGTHFWNPPHLVPLVEVDLVVKEGFGMRLAVMGPLENSDLVGLDLTLNIHKFLLSDLDTSTEPQKLLQAKVQAGELGMSVGQGFRSWTPEKAKEAKVRMWQYLVKAEKERRAK